MRNDRPPYYKVRRGRAFFELGRERASNAGMKASVPLGPDGDAARAQAWALYFDWREKNGRGEPTKSSRAWPKGSLGSFFDAYMTTRAWAKKSAATRKEWEYIWQTHLADTFGRKRINAISPAEFAEFQERVEEQRGGSARWRMVKVSRALFKAAIDNHVITASPAKSLPNPLPKGRREVWRAAEIAKLIEAAEKISKPAMALAIRIAWETALAPVDVRTLALSMLRRDAAGAWFETARAKTGAVVISAISAELDAAIRAYAEGLGAALFPDEPFLRTSRDAHRYLKARFLDDFDKVRRAAFSDDETRRFQDIRRSANLEAALGDATPEERAEMLANNLDRDAALEETYTPPTVERSRKIAKKRAIGRRLLAVQSVNTPGEGGKKV